MAAKTTAAPANRTNPHAVNPENEFVETQLPRDETQLLLAEQQFGPSCPLGSGSYDATSVPSPGTTCFGNRRSRARQNDKCWNHQDFAPRVTKYPKHIKLPQASKENGKCGLEALHKFQGAMSSWYSSAQCHELLPARRVICWFSRYLSLFIDSLYPSGCPLNMASRAVV